MDVDWAGDASDKRFSLQATVCLLEVTWSRGTARNILFLQDQTQKQVSCYG